MNRRTMLLAGAAALLTLSAVTGSPSVEAKNVHPTLAVTMTNDAASNQIKVYDATTFALLQTLATNGSGGASGNARGVRQYNGKLFAAVNNGSNSVAIYKRDGDRLKLHKVVTTTSAPVSVDFGNGHMYVAGATSVDSFVLHGDTWDRWTAPSAPIGWGWSSATWQYGASRGRGRGDTPGDPENRSESGNG